MKEGGLPMGAPKDINLPPCKPKDLGCMMNPSGGLSVVALRNTTKIQHSAAPYKIYLYLEGFNNPEGSELHAGPNTSSTGVFKTTATASSYPPPLNDIIDNIDDWGLGEEINEFSGHQSSQHERYAGAI